MVGRVVFNCVAGLLTVLACEAGFAQAESLNVYPAPPSETEKAIEKVDAAVTDAVGTAKDALARTKEVRSQSEYFALFNYSPIDLLVPSKMGGTIGIVRTVDKTWEFEFLQGSLSVPFIVKDLGKMTDRRMSFVARTYMGSNSFNVSYGLSYFDFKLNLGDALLGRVSGGSYPYLDLVELTSLGFNFGIGNRWSFQNKFTIGVDWIQWSQPVFGLSKKSAFLDYATNQQDRDDVDTALKVIAFSPRLTVLKIQLGMVF